jgi:lipopolysaccharide transport system ATP-binding protein
MSALPRVAVRGLSKVFPRHRRNVSKGLSTGGVKALVYLMRRTMKPAREESLPGRDDEDYFRALDDVSFDVFPGEVFGIIGRNGAGKTTLLKVLARVLNPSAGRVTIRGRMVSMLELGIGFAPELTVRENIQVHGRLAGISTQRIDAAEEDILEFAGLTDFREVPLGACPSGSAVQLGFATMVNLEAEIILADEVLAVGDAQFRHACEERVRAAGRSGGSVLFVSHDMNAIRRICTKVAWIDRGRIVRVGPTAEVVEAYTSELLAGALLPPGAREGLAASCRLLDLRLLDADHAQIGALQITEPAYVDCLLRVEMAHVSVSVQIELWQGKNHVLTGTSEPASWKGVPATFRIGLAIPPDFLNEGDYEARCRVYVRAARDPGGAALVVAEERLAISVMNPHPERSVWAGWRWGRSGVVSPRLRWSGASSEPSQTSVARDANRTPIP